MRPGPVRPSDEARSSALQPAVENRPRRRSLQAQRALRRPQKRLCPWRASPNRGRPGLQGPRGHSSPSMLPRPLRVSPNRSSPRPSRSRRARRRQRLSVPPVAPRRRWLVRQSKRLRLRSVAPKGNVRPCRENQPIDSPRSGLRKRGSNSNGGRRSSVRARDPKRRLRRASSALSAGTRRPQDVPIRRLKRGPRNLRAARPFASERKGSGSGGGLPKGSRREVGARPKHVSHPRERLPADVSNHQALRVRLAGALSQWVLRSTNARHR